MTRTIAASQRLLSLLSIGARDLTVGAWENFGYVLGSLSAVSLTCVFVKVITYLDWLAIACFLIGVFGWIVIALMHGSYEERKKDTSVGLKPHRRVWQTCSIAAFASMFFLMQPTATTGDRRGIWISASSQQTTLTRGAIAIVPFWSRTQYVEAYFEPQEQELHVESANGTPLLCNVSAYNIDPDRRNVPALEKYLLALAGTYNVSKYLNSALHGALTSSALTTLPTLTTADLAAHEARFKIPLAVGSPLVRALTGLHLRWRDGGINANCRVVFQN